MNRSDVVEAVIEELDAATRKFPHWPNDPLHAVAILNEEMGELAQAVLQCTYETGKATRAEVLKEASQLAAMAIRFIMSMPRYEYERSEQHRLDVACSEDIADAIAISQMRGDSHEHDN